MVLPDDCFEKILAALDCPDLVLKVCPREWWRVFLWLIDELGLRRGEVMGLTWGKVDWLGERIEIVAESSKGRRTRFLPASDELLDVLRAWREECGRVADTDLVLPWDELDHRRIYEDWDVIIAGAGVPMDGKIVPKNFRSNCGSKLIESGASTMTVKDFLGHASVTTTERHYANAGATLRPASEARRAAKAKRAAKLAEQAEAEQAKDKQAKDEQPKE